MTDDETDAQEQPGYLLDWELKAENMHKRVIITDTNPEHIPGFHREGCAYFTQPYTTVQPKVAELAFEAELQRNRRGGPRTAYFDPRCMVRRIGQSH